MYVCVERERLSVQARVIMWRGRERTCKPVTASLLHTAPGLRDSPSPRFPSLQFEVISISAVIFFCLAFYLPLLTDALPSSFTLSQDLRINSLKMWVDPFSGIKRTFAEDSP